MKKVKSLESISSKKFDLSLIQGGTNYPAPVKSYTDVRQTFREGGIKDMECTTTLTNGAICNRDVV